MPNYLSVVRCKSKRCFKLQDERFMSFFAYSRLRKSGFAATLVILLILDIKKALYNVNKGKVFSSDLNCSKS